MLYIYHKEQKIPTQKNQTKIFNHSHFLKPEERFHTSFLSIQINYVHMIHQHNPETQQQGCEGEI